MNGPDARIHLMAIVLEYRSHSGRWSHADCSHGRACALPELIERAEDALGGPEWTRRAMLPQVEQIAIPGHECFPPPQQSFCVDKPQEKSR